MNKIFTALNLVTLTSILTFSAFAADMSTPPASNPPPTHQREFGKQGRGDMRRLPEMRRLRRALDLTQEQEKQIGTLLRARRDAIQALPEAERKGDAAAQIRAASAEEIRRILTPEQQLKFDALKEKAKERRKGRD